MEASWHRQLPPKGTPALRCPSEVNKPEKLKNSWPRDQREIWNGSVYSLIEHLISIQKRMLHSPHWSSRFNLCQNEFGWRKLNMWICLSQYLISMLASRVVQDAEHINEDENRVPFPTLRSDQDCYKSLEQSRKSKNIIQVWNSKKPKFWKSSDIIIKDPRVIHPDNRGKYAEKYWHVTLTRTVEQTFPCQFRGTNMRFTTLTVKTGVPYFTQPKWAVGGVTHHFISSKYCLKLLKLLFAGNSEDVCT